MGQFQLYERTHSESLPDTLKQAIIKGQAPPHIKAQVDLQTYPIGTSSQRDHDELCSDADGSESADEWSFVGVDTYADGHRSGFPRKGQGQDEGRQ